MCKLGTNPPGGSNLLPAAPAQQRAAGAAARPPWRRLPPRRPSQRCAGLGDELKKLYEATRFENWAPRSSRTWRLQKPDRPTTEGELSQASIDLLNERLAGARQQAGGLATGEEEAGVASTSSAEAAAEQRQQGGTSAGSGQQQWGEGPEEEAGAAFTRSTDEDFADALNRRIVEVAPALSSSEDEEEEQEELTGQLLRELVYAKYGKTYDLNFKRDRLPLGKTLVCLNILWTHLEQKSFPMTETDYLDKLDGIAFYLRAWGQDSKVVEFLKAPAKPRKGLPSRPIVGTAVSIQLDLDQAIIDEFFPAR